MKGINEGTIVSIYAAKRNDLAKKVLDEEKDNRVITPVRLECNGKYLDIQILGNLPGYYLGKNVKIKTHADVQKQGVVVTQEVYCEKLASLLRIREYPLEILN